MSKEISDGIITAHLEGIITSTSLMINMPDAKRAVGLAKQVPSLDVGIHLNITQGHPILPPEKVSTLVNSSGEFLSNTELIPKLKKFKVNWHEIEAEFSAQVNKMLDMGLRPTHMDSHHHVHIYPTSAWAFKRVANKFGIRRVRAIRYHLPYFSNSDRLKYYRKFVIVTLKNFYKLFIQKFLWHDMISPDYTIIISLLRSYSDSSDVQEQWIRLLKYLPKGTFDAGCHPGYDSKYYRDRDPWSDRRKKELNALTSIKEIIARSNIELINFCSLK